MQSIYYVLIFFVLILASVSVFSAIFSAKKSQDSSSSLRKISLEINSHKFEVEVAETDADRKNGLMYRTQMNEGVGMLFIFERAGIYPFWMMNTFIPLDIIWIGEDKKVVYISRDVQPCKNPVEAICKSIIPTALSKYVLEINGGLTEKLGIKVGDAIEF